MDNKKTYDYLIKLVMVGDAGVGKTNLVWRFCDDIYQDNYISTIGVDFKFKSFTIDESIVKLQIWDTAGQERFRTITAAYYRGAQGLLLCYDITSRATFDHLLSWMQEIRRHTASLIMLVGCKLDLRDGREISEQEADEFAAKYNTQVCEVSSKENHNVQSLFKTTATYIILKLKEDNKLDLIAVYKQDSQNSKNGNGKNGRSTSTSIINWKRNQKKDIASSLSSNTCCTLL